MAGIFAWLGCAPAPAQKQEVKFTGTLEAVNVGCWADGICSMRISGKEIVFGKGWSAETYGDLLGFDSSKLDGREYIGREVEVFGWKSGESILITGDKKYYIKLLDVPIP
jgi:hypothetical protein